VKPQICDPRAITTYKIPFITRSIVSFQAAAWRGFMAAI